MRRVCLLLLIVLAVAPIAAAQASSFIACPQGFYWAGAWSATTAYPKCAVAQIYGSSWIAIVANVNQLPGIGSKSWSLLASAGQAGKPGLAATVAVGSVVTLPPGSMATVKNSGTSQAATLNFGIPAGVAGQPGPEIAGLKSDGADGIIVAGKV